MKVYALYNGTDTVCEVEVETVSWLPVKPRISGAWLKLFIETSLRSYFRRTSSVVNA